MRTATRHSAAAAVAVAALLVVLAACGGDNLFAGRDLYAPVVQGVGFTADTARAGATVGVVVEATSTTGIREVRVAFWGAVVQDTSVEVSPTQAVYRATIPVTLPDTIADSFLTATVTVVDVDDLVSSGRSASLPAVGPRRP